MPQTRRIYRSTRLPVVTQNNGMQNLNFMSASLNPPVDAENPRKTSANISESPPPQNIRPNQAHNIQPNQEAQATEIKEQENQEKY